MAWIRRLLAGAALVCAVVGTAVAADVVYSKFDGRVVDELVRECAGSYRIRQFSEDEGRLPLVVIGALWVNNTWDDIWQDVDITPFMRRLQDALINSSDALEFVASSHEREVLREEKRDQDFHVSIDSAKAMDNETAADFMLQGELGLLGASEKELYCQLVIQLVDIETNRIVFSSVKDVTIRGVKVKTAKQTKQAKQKQVRERDTISTADWEPSGNWDRYKAQSLAFPLVRRGFDGNDGAAECEYRADFAMGYDVSTFHVNYPTHITLMTKYGIGIEWGTMSADYGWGDEIEQDDIWGPVIYAQYGAGLAINILGIMIIPTAGVGMTLDALLAPDEEEEDDDSYTFQGCNFTVDAFVNVFAALMFNKNLGLSFSFEMSKNLCGVGSFGELGGYGMNFFDIASYTYTIGICSSL